jgi:hypothetical protein
MRTDILMVLDKSGSMAPLTDDVIGGFNTFIAEQQRVPGIAHVSVWMFDTNRHPALHRRTPLSEVRPLDRDAYSADGSTSLYDAVGQSVDEAGRWFAELPDGERPEQVVMVVQTDGHENTSRQFSAAQVREKIERQQHEWGWKFIFMGADQDAWDTGGALGIGTSFSYDNSGIGTRSVYRAASESVRGVRSSGVLEEQSVDLRSKGGEPTS